MLRSIITLVVALQCLALCGCLSEAHTRFPTLFPRHHSRIQRQASEFHDPYPSNQLGPNVDQRPRGFNIPRTETRGGKEAAAEVERIKQSRRLAPPQDLLGKKYPKVVRP